MPTDLKKPKPRESLGVWLLRRFVGYAAAAFAGCGFFIIGAMGYVLRLYYDKCYIGSETCADQYVEKAVWTGVGGFILLLIAVVLVPIASPDYRKELRGGIWLLTAACFLVGIFYPEWGWIELHI